MKDGDPGFDDSKAGKGTQQLRQGLCDGWRPRFGGGRVSGFEHEEVDAGGAGVEVEVCD